MKTKESRRRIKIKKSGSCLLIKNERFSIFTEKKFSGCLIEVCRRFSTALLLVRVDEVQLAQLDEIADILSQDEPFIQVCNYSVIKTYLSEEPKLQSTNDLSKVTKTRKQRSEEIRTAIRSEMLKGNAISVNYLVDVLKDFNLSNSQIRYYLKSVKENMELEGFTFIKKDEINQA